MKDPNRSVTVAFKVSPEIKALIEEEAVLLRGSISQVLRRIVHDYYEKGRRLPTSGQIAPHSQGLRQPEASTASTQGT